MEKGSVSSMEEGIEIGKEANKIMAENIFMIHVGMSNRPYIYSNRIGNVSERSVRVQEYGCSNPPQRYYQWWIKYPQGEKPAE